MRPDRTYAARALKRRLLVNRLRLWEREREASRRPCVFCHAPYEAQEWKMPALLASGVRPDPEGDR